MKILCYVSGHGFGHAFRACTVLQALQAVDPNLEISVRSQAPPDVFENLAGARVLSGALDVGMVENGLFAQDVRATLERYMEILAVRDRLVEAEVRFIRAERFDLILSDIPPLASDIAAAAGIPVIAIGNFSWDFIYSPYVARYPEYSNVLESIRNSYRKTDLLLRLSLHAPMDVFPRVEDIPLIVRKSATLHEQTMRDLGIPESESRPIVFLALRTAGQVDPRCVEEFASTGEFIVLATAPTGLTNGGAVKVLGHEWGRSRFPDVVAISDVVIAKLGYGILSECIAARTPLLYGPRYDFAEFEVLASESATYLPSGLISIDDFRVGNWAPAVSRLLCEAREFEWPRVELNGAEVAARRIISSMRG